MRITAPLSALAVLLLASSASAQCTEDLCRCTEELIHAVEGDPVDASRLTGLGGDPERMFSRGGSLNIPVVCRAAKYGLDGDPAWFLEYFRLQEEPTQPGLMGTEQLSPLYTAPVLGSLIALRSEAVERGRMDLVDAVSRWLRALWGVMALAAVEEDIGSATVRHHSDDVELEGNRFYTGPSVPVAGARTTRDGNIGPGSLLHPFFSLALESTPRQYRANLRNSPGFYGGLLIAAVTLGYPVPGDGRVDFESRPIPPEMLGLSPADRAALRRFVASRGAEGLAEVIAMIGTFRPSCDMTFLRTDRGVFSYFGTTETEQRICNRNKGPYFAARFDYATRHATYLRPNVANNPAEGARSFRRGDEVCAVLDDGHERCIDVIGGALVYEVTWTKRDGITVLTGSAGPPEGDDARVLRADFPDRLDPGQAFTAEIEVENTGDNPWTRGLSYRLGSQAPMDNQTFGAGRIDLPAGLTVGPGERHTFVLELVAPDADGVYDAQWRMVREHVHWFGEPSPLRRIAVGDAEVPLTDAGPSSSEADAGPPTAPGADAGPPGGVDGGCAISEGGYVPTWPLIVLGALALAARRRR